MTLCLNGAIKDTDVVPGFQELITLESQDTFHERIISDTLLGERILKGGKICLDWVGRENVT